MSAKTVPVDADGENAAVEVPETAETTTAAPEKEDKQADQKNDKKKKDKKTKKSKNQAEKKVEPQKRVRPRKHGDIVLKKQDTIDVIVKYQMGQPELKMMKKNFGVIDEDNSGEIDYDEFFSHIHEKRNYFNDGMFKMTDLNGSGTVDFEEFVCAVTTYCMYTRDEILRFAFDSFDVDGSGSIDEDEFKRLLNVVNDGKPLFPANFLKAIKEFDRNGDGLIDFEEFQDLNKRYPLLLFPCFRLQDRLQRGTLGIKHWHMLHKRYFKYLKLQEYKRKHNGAEPPISISKRFKKLLGIGVIDVYQP